MAEAAQFEQGTLIDVWSPAGKNANGEARYRRANFDILKWQSYTGGPVDTYVVPLGSDRYVGGDVNIKNDTSVQVGQEFGYYSKDSMFVEPHQGDGSDTIQGLHSFGPV